MLKKRLKVLLWHWGRKGGGPRYTLELARVLAARSDLEIHLSISRQSEMYSAFDSIPVGGRFDVDTYTTPMQFALRSLKLPLLRQRFQSYIKDNNVDIVFCTMDHLWNAFIIGGVRNAGALYLLTVHDATRHPGEDQSWRRWLLKRDIDASDGALVLTRSVGESLVKNYNYPTERIYHSTLGHFGDAAPAHARELPAMEQRPVRLLFFGRILDYKGLDIMLEALPFLRQKYPALELEIWGTGDLSSYRPQLDQLKNIRIENRWIEEDEIPGIFSRTDLAVLPYREASQSAVVATAFAVGMPCVATPIPGLCEQINDGVTGVIASSVDASAFAAAVTRVLDDPSFYNQLSNGCLEATNTTLNWETIGNSVADAFYNLYRTRQAQQLAVATSAS